MTVPLTRDALAARTGIDADAAPVRIVHLGLGHFFRAHQAWYTARSVDAAEWGIAAFTGRSAGIADTLQGQDGLFALVERGAEGDGVEIVTSLVEARPGTDTARLVELVADPAVAVITLTVTESGYRLTPDGTPDLGDAALAADLEVLRGGSSADRGPQTALGRLVLALDARRRADAGPIAVVSCDNIPGNGAFVRRGATALAEAIDPALADWMRTEVSFVSTSVDRITPHGDESPGAVADAGWEDHAAVVTEPFADWVLAGDFPAGRPEWESAGARFVDDIEPWEHRKLWLLNGAHSILTFAGLPRGLETVADATADAHCRALVEAFWSEAVQCLPAGTEHVHYREQLIERFSNPRIVHRLSQIAAEATVKAQFRFAAVAERSVAAGRDAEGSLQALGTWIAWVLDGPSAPDARADEVAAAAASIDPVRSLLGLVSPMLAADTVAVARVRAAASLRPTLARRAS
ncbi:mannitol dehydrogenase family protein [Microbacterium hominis]|uniref:Mannitol-1-phosphate 5-dehydrogenase n=1 Tax=Microbacterium hominis TaxID=162426 RepID=A0A7D4PSN9_9MICO|nr:mannitol dehydrogenase family protein [Microbacterium hominis]QKJ18173.1 mannitol dehydrogenase family protein [Microbacterium hominis]